MSEPLGGVEKLKQIQHLIATICFFLFDRLCGKGYFSGKAFGIADLCVVPILNWREHYGFGPVEEPTL